MAQRRWSDVSFVECKTWGHAWEEYNPIGSTSDRPGLRMTLECVRCHTRRHDFLNPQGHVTGRQYFYAEGYRSTDAFGQKPTRDEMRLIIIKRTRRD